MNLKQETQKILTDLGITLIDGKQAVIQVQSPITGQTIGAVPIDAPKEIDHKIHRAHQAFKEWRNLPAPRRGELVRLLGEELRRAKPLLGRLVTIECGKPISEGLGEVQEMIDICDFAVGLSRQLYGLTIASERPGHRMMETWHPIGVTGVISAFNFPAAVWSWNAAIALVCGNSVIWKPSEKTPLTALACMSIAASAIDRFGSDAPDGLIDVVIGHKEAAEILVDDKRIPLVSATGSTQMGRAVSQRLARRFARSILELGGNNAGIVCPSANLDMALQSVLFSAVGTTGQRCTSMRRLFLHESIYDEFMSRLRAAYCSIHIGNPLDSTKLIGPLIDEDAFNNMQAAIKTARKSGGKVWGGERVDLYGNEAFYVEPALIEMPEQTDIVKTETFAPILYIIKYAKLSEAIDQQNSVSAGLSSTILTQDMREAELFMSSAGSDCGIANVNIGTSGAEIGGAFGGEKETGGGRESGSDAWKAYMRRATNTINYSDAIPLAQGVEFRV